MKTLEIDEKLRIYEGGVLTKVLIFQLLITQEYQTWYRINAKTRPCYSVAGCISHLIPALININGNIRNKSKIAEN